MKFNQGDRVRVVDTFWIPTYRGQVGTVWSVTTSADGYPTCFVRFGDAGGQWILAEDLTGVQ